MHTVIIILVALYGALWVFVGLVNQLVGYRALNHPTPCALWASLKSWARAWWDGSHG